MRSWVLQFLSHSCPALLCVAMMVQPVKADPMVDFIFEQFQEQCDAEQANFRGIDDDLDAPLRGVLSLSEDAIYDIALTPDCVFRGMVGTDFI